MGFFTPIYLRSNLNLRQRRKALEKVKSMTDPQMLNRVALEATDRAVREAAVDKLDDGDVLLRVAAEEPKLFPNALNRAEEQRLEETIARLLMLDNTLEDGRVRRALSLVRKQPLLSEIARSAPSAIVRRATLSRVKDTATLMEIVKNDVDPTIRRDAVIWIEDDAAQARIALENPEKSIRLYAIDNSHMTDTSALEKLALEDDDRDIRLHAVANRHTPAATLARIALEDSDPLMRLEAVKNTGLADQAVLARVALEDPSFEVCMQAVQNPRLKDGRALSRIALGSRFDLVRKVAVDNEHMTDPSTLNRVALEAESKSLGLSALKRITDAAVIADIALQARCADVREAAVANESMTDSATLAQIARLDADTSVRNAAIHRLNDANLLREIANSDMEAASTRYEAAMRLSKFDPDGAVAPLVWYMQHGGATHEAVQFLLDRYKTTPSAAVRANIATLPDKTYGHGFGDGCIHVDAHYHFDLPR